MNLILQGLTADRAAIDRIATLADAQRIVQITANAWRCEGTGYSDALKAQIDSECFAARLDYAFVEPGRKLSDFRLVTMDMDSTLITIECIDEIADMQGLKPQVAEITEAAMRGEIEFRESLTRRVALLKGLDAGALQRVYDERLKLSLGAETMLNGVKAAGLKTLLVSGGFTFFTDRLRERLRLDSAHANTLEIDNGVLTGRVLGDILDADAKAVYLREFARTHGATKEQIIAMGDGANDLKMLGAAGFPVAYHAKPLVRQQTRYALNVSGLDGVLNWFES